MGLSIVWQIKKFDHTLTKAYPIEKSSIEVAKCLVKPMARNYRVDDWKYYDLTIWIWAAKTMPGRRIRRPGEETMWMYVVMLKLWPWTTQKNRREQVNTKMVKFKWSSKRWEFPEKSAQKGCRRKIELAYLSTFSNLAHRLPWVSRGSI